MNRREYLEGNADLCSLPGLFSAKAMQGVDAPQAYFSVSGDGISLKRPGVDSIVGIYGDSVEDPSGVVSKN